MKARTKAESSNQANRNESMKLRSSVKAGFSSNDLDFRPDRDTTITSRV